MTKAARGPTAQTVPELKAIHSIIEKSQNSSGERPGINPERVCPEDRKNFWGKNMNDLKTSMNDLKTSMNALKTSVEKMSKSSVGNTELQSN